MPLITGIVGPVPEGRDAEEYDKLRRRVMWSMPSGLYVIGSRAGERRNAMTADWVSQVCSDPKLVSVAVRGAASRRDALHAARSVANSPLVKTALNGEDPNWGRIMMARGKSPARVVAD